MERERQVNKGEMLDVSVARSNPFPSDSSNEKRPNNRTTHRPTKKNRNKIFKQTNSSYLISSTNQHLPL